MKKFSKDYYAILKISPSANSDEIRIAYRKLAKQNHPDLGGSAQAMADINEAYSVLQDNKSMMCGMPKRISSSHQKKPHKTIVIFLSRHSLSQSTY